MRILVAGATGVIGRPTVDLLHAAGHDVIGLSRSSATPRTSKRGEPVYAACDILNEAQVSEKVASARPDAIVHLATAIPRQLNPRRIGSDFAATNALRTVGTRHLIAAARANRVERFVSQSIAFAYRPAAGLAAETDALWHDCPTAFRPVLAAVESLEDQTAEVGGTTLRFGHMHGPGTAFADGGSTLDAVRAGKMPIVGAGAAEFSFTHVRDAASAVLAAVESEQTGVFNIVDDWPVDSATWITELAERLGAPEPRHYPAAIARLAAGAWGVAFLDKLRGASNAKARAELDWRPSVARWEDIGDTPGAARE